MDRGTRLLALVSMVFTATSLFAAAAGVVQQLLHVSRRSEAQATELRNAVAVAAAVAAALAGSEETIIAELLGAQGSPVVLGGYYHPDAAACDRAMRPSPTLNGILESL